ncbi:DedA family protein [Limobrevibacterium gyesilva]|nr:DedA family protein [Limobrevibacterium gyesilva]
MPLADLIAIYGYWVVAVVVGLESIGLPVPGETTLVAAAIYAGTTHRLGIALVIAAAATGAVIGDNIGYWIGREAGYPLLLRHGRRMGLAEDRLKLGQYLFLRHGGKMVFFGRFVAILRALAALLAGANRMPWGSFFAFNVAGGVVWATLVGLGAYVLGDRIHQFLGPVGWTMLVLAGIAGVGGWVFWRRHAARLLADAERALPGPLAPARRRPR